MSASGAVPAPLPDLALGWPLILHIERAGFVALLIVGVGGIVLGILRGGTVQATGGGPLPTVEVAPETGEDADLKLRRLTDRLLDIDRRVSRLEQMGNGQA